LDYNAQEILKPKLSEQEFNEFSMDLFHFHAENNEVYKAWIWHLGIDRNKIKCVEEIPYLPIRFFKTHKILVGSSYEKVFLSSSTTGKGESKHMVKDLEWYKKSFIQCFEQNYGSISDIELFSLLPAYAERTGSSLIYMVDELQKISGSKQAHYLYDFSALDKDLKAAIGSKKKVILIGVSFALLDFVETLDEPIEGLTVIETGGMKGRKKELTKDELHKKLKEGFRVDHIHSEYGMTELLSQAYQKDQAYFSCPAWMKVSFVDPRNVLGDEVEKGQLRVIDLANVYSCPFILTDDLGQKMDNGFKVIGRLDQSDLRGCSLLTA
jgi:phenylacetate-coenzyme A ligase PaaK-like adenylate-forming protein